MTKSEALEFLELPETATDSEIKIRVEEKLAYFERLSEKAPSDFLKRLHARNAAKVSEIQMLSRKWPSYVPPELASQSDPLMQPNPEPEFVQEEEDEEMAPEAVAKGEPAVTMEPVVKTGPAVTKESIATEEPLVMPDPVIGAVIDAGLDPVVEPEAIAETITPKPVVNPEPVVMLEPEAASGLEPVAWLIRHTENQSARTFPLYPGKNFLGRKPRPDLIPFIEVEEDPYISKVHAVLYAEKDKLFISDPSGEEGKPSKNGIFINADDNRLTEKTRLRENDTIQIGVTKLILRYNNNPIVKIVQEVEEQDYMHTVVIDIS